MCWGYESYNSLLSLSSLWDDGRTVTAGEGWLPYQWSGDRTISSWLLEGWSTYLKLRPLKGRPVRSKMAQATVSAQPGRRGCGVVFLRVRP